VADRRLVDFQDILNRTVNKTVSQARLTIVTTTPAAPFAVIGYVVPGTRNVFGSIPLNNQVADDFLET
jgi:hypothetical protein